MGMKKGFCKALKRKVQNWHEQSRGAAYLKKKKNQIKKETEGKKRGKEPLCNIISLLVEVG